MKKQVWVEPHPEDIEHYKNSKGLRESMQQIATEMDVDLESLLKGAAELLARTQPLTPPFIKAKKAKKVAQKAS